MATEQQHLHHLSPDAHDAPDAWHKHTAEEKAQSPHAEVANAPMITTVGVGLFLLVVTTVVLCYGYYTWYTTGLLERMEGQDPAYRHFGLEGDAVAARQQARADLAGYNWVTPAPPVIPEGTVQIPLEKAKAKVIKAYVQQAAATPGGGAGSERK